MGTSFLIKKEGLENIQKLDTLQINKIASFISNTLCEAFPELHLSQSDLFIQISRLDMYKAKMPDGASAKYVYGNSEIYFNENLDFDNIDIPAIHECIHYIQETKDSKGKLLKLGLYDLTKETGLAINEAAVQLVATRSKIARYENVIYYGMNFQTESPEYYPLECALLSQMVYFTGNEPMYFSTLYGNTMFEKEFRNASTGNSYTQIVNEMDKLLYVENDLNLLSQKLLNADQGSSRLLQFQIENKKKSIISHCLKTQNMIIQTCLNRRFQDIQSFDDIRDYENTLEDFKKMLIMPENYSFYEDYCLKMQDKIRLKKDQIIKFGKVLDTPKEYIYETDETLGNNSNLPVATSVKKLSKFQQFLQALKDIILG